MTGSRTAILVKRINFGVPYSVSLSALEGAARFTFLGRRKENSKSKSEIYKYLN